MKSWLLAFVLLLTACGTKVDLFEPTVDMKGDHVTIGLHTDLPEDAVVHYTLSRYYSVGGRPNPLRMTLTDGGKTVAELQKGLTVSVAEEARAFRADVRQRHPHNPHWGELAIMRRHRLAMSISDEGLSGKAVDEGRAYASKEFQAGKREVVSGTRHTTNAETKEAIRRACMTAQLAVDQARATARARGVRDTDAEMLRYIRARVMEDTRLSKDWELDQLLKNCRAFDYEVI